jgi:hypothetical protein
MFTDETCGMVYHAPAIGESLALQRSQSYAATIHPRSPNPPELRITEVVLQTARWQEMKDWYSAFLGVEPFFETETMCFRRVSHAHNQLFVLFHFPDLQERPVAAYRAYVQSDAFRRNPCGIAIDQDEWEASCARMLAAGFRRVPSYNPYWDVHGRTFEDLDGYRVVLQNTVWTM